MIDAVVIGGGVAGASIAAKLQGSGLAVAVVEKAEQSTDTAGIEVYRGIGVVKSRNTVTILDSKTGDEQRILECRVIILATGKPDEADQASKMLGIDKLGIRSREAGPQIQVGPEGATVINTIFAVGDCANIAGVDPAENIVRICESKRHRLENL